MELNRRDWWALAGSLMLGCGAGARTAAKARAPSVIAVDAFVLFDPRPFRAALEQALPGASAFVDFRTRLFEYGWLRALAGRYRDFARLSADALDATAEARGGLSAAKREALLDIWHQLPAWPDAQEGVETLRRQGHRVAVLSNWSPSMLGAGLARTGLTQRVRALSTDAIQSYKPDPRAYALAMDSFGAERSAVTFIAFAAWDAAGASWFGYRTLWMNRASAPPERLDLERVTVTRSFPEASRLIGRAS